MKQRFESVIRHIAEWSPNDRRHVMDDFQPGFWGSLDPLMDAECRIPSGSCIKLEYSALAEERRYLVYPDFRFRGGVR